VTSFLPAVAAYLASLGHGFWSETEPYPPDAVGIALGTAPAAPDRAVTLATYAAPESNSNEPYDLLNVQVRVRGTADFSVSADHAQAIYDDLHGLGGTDLPGGVRLVNSVCLQGAPIYMGTDGNNRHEHTVNVRMERLNPTALRATS
jgi:hypothetical protein